MRITIGALMISTLVLSSCGGWRDSRVNPTNWFGKSRETTNTVDENLNPLIPQEEEKTNLLGRKDDKAEDRSLPIAVIKDMRIERTAIFPILKELKIPNDICRAPAGALQISDGEAHHPRGGEPLQSGSCRCSCPAGCGKRKRPRNPPLKTPTDSNKKRATVNRARFLLLGHITMRSEVDDLHQLSLGRKRNLTIAQAQRV